MSTNLGDGGGGGGVWDVDVGRCWWCIDVGGSGSQLNVLCHALHGCLTPCVTSVAGWSAMNVYLTALALSDTAMLYTGTFPVWARKVFG